MRDPLADAIAAIGDRPATSFRVVKSSAQAGKVTIAGADVAVSPWIGDQPPAGDPVLLLMAEDGSSVAVSGGNYGAALLDGAGKPGKGAAAAAQQTAKEEGGA
jgi:hypothetical protein